MRVNLGICEGCLLISLLTDWKKKKGNQYKKYRPISGYSYFIRKGAFYLERRRERRAWAISSIFFSRSYLRKFFFSRQLYKYIHRPFITAHAAFYLYTPYILIYWVNLHGLLIWNWFQIHSIKICNFPQVIIRQASVTNVNNGTTGFLCSLFKSLLK